MKFLITLKDPDGLDYAITDALQHDYNATSDQLKSIAKKWFEYGEYLTVEIDTETKSIKVLEN